MPYSPPARPVILDRVKADIRAELGVDPLRRSVEYALARALTGQAKGLYGYLAWAFRQCFPDRADAEYFWQWAGIFGVDQKAAAPWRGVVRFTGVDTTAIPISTSIVRSDGATYTTDAADTIGSVSSGYVDIACTAASGYEGVDGNNDDGQPLSLVTPIADVDNTCTVQSTTTDGSDLESAEDGLTRLLIRLRTPPSGGGPGDYKAWALEISGVTRAWEFANLYGPNTVGVAFVRDDDGTGAAIIPSAGEIATVQAHLDSVAPITVGVTVITVAASSLNVTISGLNPDTAAVRAAIQTELEDLLVREGAPGGTITRSQLSSAISAAAGEVSHVLDAPAADVAFTSAQVPILGTLSFV